jgi:hypothetical protein
MVAFIGPSWIKIIFWCNMLIMYSTFKTWKQQFVFDIYLITKTILYQKLNIRRTKRAFEVFQIEIVETIGKKYIKTRLTIT